MDRLISLQAAIDALTKHLRTTDVPASYPGIITALTEWLDELPPAQPEPIWGLSVSAERPLADAEIVLRLRTIQKQVGGSYALDRAIEIIEAVASAQSEIIYCKDCRWQKDQSGSTAWLPCRALVTPDEFHCGRAERRIDGD